MRPGRRGGEGGNVLFRGLATFMKVGLWVGLRLFSDSCSVVFYAVGIN